MAAIVQQWVDENNNKEEESTPAAIEICEYIMSMASDDDTSVEDLTSVIVGLDISSHFNEMDLNKQTQLVENLKQRIKNKDNNNNNNNTTTTKVEEVTNIDKNIDNALATSTNKKSSSRRNRRRNKKRIILRKVTSDDSKPETQKDDLDSNHHQNNNNNNNTVHNNNKSSSTTKINDGLSSSSTNGIKTATITKQWTSNNLKTLSELAPENTNEELLSYILYKECNGNLQEAALFLTMNDMNVISKKMSTAKKKQLEKETLEKEKLAAIEKKEHRMMLDKFLVVNDNNNNSNAKKNKTKVAKSIRREQRKAQELKKNKPMMYLNGQKMGNGVKTVDVKKKNEWVNPNPSSGMIYRKSQRLNSRR